jgi:prepilin-type N-terminal cleavage/methylation domain-containing protein/prepilin-type processing-associated H-X9-DG protein
MKSLPSCGRDRRLCSRASSGDEGASRRRSGRRAFTLIELLTVATIVAVLAAILVPVTGSMLRKGKMGREINAGRQIMVAYAAYAAENNGQLLPGYDKNVGSVTLADGTQVSGIMCARYPWRLAPYIGSAMDDIFLINDTRKKTDALKHDSHEYQYLASLFPALGINGYCVGGYDDASGEGNFSTDVVRTLAGASHGSKLIVFASARYTDSAAKKGDKETPGFHLVTPPNMWRTKWSRPFDRKKAASSFGHVDLRWDGKAVCAFLDGHVEVLGEPQIADMRLWSNMAAEANNEFFAVPR